MSAASIAMRRSAAAVLRHCSATVSVLRHCSTTVSALRHCSTTVWGAAGPAQLSAASHLRERLGSGELTVAPCSHDALSAQLIQRAGFTTQMLSGFCVAASKGMPDTGLATFSEMQSAVHEVAAVTRLPNTVIVDGDTGYGNEISLKRAVKAFARAGAGAVMVEDQTFPKRCGFTGGKGVVEKHEALSRVRAACDARDEGADILILARTDARGPLGLQEALERCAAFHELGADITHIAGLQSVEDCEAYCEEVAGPKMHNNNSAAFVLPPARLQQLGFALAIYPDLLLGASIRAMDDALAALRAGDGAAMAAVGQPFSATRAALGFAEYDTEMQRYTEAQAEFRIRGGVGGGGGADAGGRGA